MLSIWRRWLRNTDMLFKMSNFIHKRGGKVSVCLEMLERHDSKTILCLEISEVLVSVEKVR